MCQVAYPMAHLGVPSNIPSGEICSYESSNVAPGLWSPTSERERSVLLNPGHVPVVRILGSSYPRALRLLTIQSKAFRY